MKRQIAQLVIFTYLLFALGGAAAGCAPGHYLSRTSRAGQKDRGLAVYYSDRLHGRKTASGELYDKQKMTAAHRHLPFGSVVRVTNLANRRAVRVRINDRGPFDSKKRIIDLSRAAAKRLGMIQAGVVQVEIELVSLPSPRH